LNNLLPWIVGVTEDSVGGASLGSSTCPANGSIGGSDGCRIGVARLRP
jgi:hypothetical protein